MKRQAILGRKGTRIYTLSTFYQLTWGNTRLRLVKKHISLAMSNVCLFQIPIIVSPYSFDSTFCIKRCTSKYSWIITTLHPKVSFSRLLSDTFIELINLSSLSVTVLKRPYLSASLGGLWLAGRIFYTIGYSSGDPKRRLTRGGYLSSAALIGQYPSLLVDVYL